MHPILVLPTYNERANLWRLLHEIWRMLPSLEVLVVDDNSPDGTGIIADELKRRRPNQVHVIHRASKDGLGRAYEAGFRYALEGPWDLILQMDADFAHDPQDLARLLDRASRADLVIGSRYQPVVEVAANRLLRARLSRFNPLPSRDREGAGFATGCYGFGGGRRITAGRRSMCRSTSHVANACARALLRSPLHDLTSGFKCWRREALERVLRLPPESSGPVFQVEMTHRLWLLGGRIHEAPVGVRSRRAGKSKRSWRTVWEGARRIIEMRLESHERAPAPKAPVIVFARTARDSNGASGAQ